MSKQIIKKKSSFESTSTSHTDDQSPQDFGGGKKFSLTTDAIGSEDREMEKSLEKVKEPRKKTRNGIPPSPKDPVKYCENIIKDKREMSPEMQKIVEDTLITHFVFSNLNHEQM